MGHMAMGLIGAMADFTLMAITASHHHPHASWTAWMPTLGWFSLGTLQAGILLALYSISSALGFRFHRIRELISEGTPLARVHDSEPEPRPTIKTLWGTVRPEFDVEPARTRSPGFNRVQQVARYMVLPSFAMAIMGLMGAMAISIVGGVHIHDGGWSVANIEKFHQEAQGVLQAGLAFVFAGITFAIALILGRFRKGGGDIQEAAGRPVEVLHRPWTSWVSLGAMMMAMMTVLTAATLHIVWGFDVHNTAASLKLSQDRWTALVGVEQLGIGMYLTAIAFGLASIIHVLRFQTRRIRELPLLERVG